MNYLNFTKYIYLAVALFMAYDAFTKYNNGTDGFWLSAILGSAALFTFFFRMKFAKKFDNRKNSANQTPK